MLELMYITNNPNMARIADEAGVDRVWIDLETKDKEIRQAGMNSVKSHHSISDIGVIKPLLKKAKMQVRVNHIYENSHTEIDEVIRQGADYVMLPYYKTNDEVKKFVDYVAGRAKTILLLETKEAVEIIDDTLSIYGVDEIHIGLNDLHLSLHQDFMFEPVSNGLVESLSKKISIHKKPFGFGGIAKLGEGMVPSELVIGEHYRLGSTRAILSRSFCTPSATQSIQEIRTEFTNDLNAIRAYEKRLNLEDTQYFEENHHKFNAAVVSAIEQIRKHK